MSATILRLSAEYLDRGALFIAGDDEFTGISAASARGGDDADDRVKSLRIPRNEPSILGDVATSGEAHRGKMRRTRGQRGADRSARRRAADRGRGAADHAREADDWYSVRRQRRHRAPIDTMTGLEIFLSQAGYAFGNAVFAAEKAATLKVLVVEDSCSMRAYLTTIIEGGTEAYDLEIVEAASGFEALKTLPHHKFDAILTDINMPDINGLELVSLPQEPPRPPHRSRSW